MMPVFWTLQTQYLAKHPTEISLPAWIASIVIFVAGWSLRFVADRQKMRFSTTQGKCLFWGRRTQGIPVSYQTRDGKTHRSLLLCSGTYIPNQSVGFLAEVSICRIVGCGPSCQLRWKRAVYMVVMLALREWGRLCIHRSLFGYRDDHPSVFSG